MKHALLLAFVLAACSPSTLQVHEVEPGLWRSNQPVSDADWASVKALGVTTIVKLNMPKEGSDDGARQLGMAVYELGIEPTGDTNVIDALTNTFKKPNEDHLRAAEIIIQLSLQTRDSGSVLVHCTHGQDRTGLVIGRHRVIADHWSKTDAYREMLHYGFHPELLGLEANWISFTAP